MGKIKLVHAERMFIPDVDVTIEENGKDVTVNNRDLDDADQIKCEIKIANIDQKSKYIGSYSTTEIGKKKKKSEEVKSFVDFKYQECIEKHCGKVTGLEDFGVTSGITLYAKSAEYAELSDIIQDVFFKICGLHEDDKKPGSDAGEMTAGED